MSLPHCTALPYTLPCYTHTLHPISYTLHSPSHTHNHLYIIPSILPLSTFPFPRNHIHASVPWLHETVFSSRAHRSETTHAWLSEAHPPNAITAAHPHPLTLNTIIAVTLPPPLRLSLQLPLLSTRCPTLSLQHNFLQHYQHPGSSNFHHHPCISPLFTHHHDHPPPPTSTNETNSPPPPSILLLLQPQKKLFFITIVDVRYSQTSLDLFINSISVGHD